MNHVPDIESRLAELRPSPLSRGFHDRIHGGLGRRWRRWRWGGAVAVLAACVLVVVGVRLSAPSLDDPFRPLRPARRSAPDATSVAPTAIAYMAAYARSTDDLDTLLARHDRALLSPLSQAQRAVLFLRLQGTERY